MRHRRTRLGLLFITFVVGAANACSNQGEGERCDKLSGNDDCASGLVCTTLTQSTTPTTGQAGAGGGMAPVTTYTAAVCCPDPATRVVATTAACQSVSSGTGNQTPEPDAGTGGAGGAAGAAGASGAAGGESGGQGGTAGASGAAGSESGGEAGAAGSAGSASGGRDGGPEAGP